MEIRRAQQRDADEAVELLLRARRAASAAGAIPPSAHADDEVRNWFCGEVVPTRSVWLATDGRVITALMVIDGDWIDQLYVAPELTGRGIGSRLLGRAKRERPGGLRLWCFESNRRAQRFYERHGFRVAARTDGSDNEERAPDRLYRWPA